MERSRARLPSADELFRRTGPRPDQSGDPLDSEDAAPQPAPEPPPPGPATGAATGQAGGSSDPPAGMLADLLDLATDEDEVLVAARAAAGADLVAASPAVGSLLAWVAATSGARHVVEVGSAGGVTGLWLLRGMTGGGILTSIESDGDAHGRAQAAFREAGVTDRVRAILGSPDEVLPRLTDQGYEVVVLRLPEGAAGTLRTHALRLLRPGGVLVVLGLAAPTTDARASRALVAELIDDDRYHAVVLPVDAGVLLAYLTPTAVV